MIQGTNIRAGMTIVFKGEPYRVLNVTHHTPGNKRGIIQTKLRSLKTGLALDNRFRTDEKVERAVLEQNEMQFLYESDGEYHFMNTENYEQTHLSADAIGEGVSYLVPDVKFMVEYFESNPVGVTPPKVVDMKITDTPPNIKGATASSSYKPATTETGLVVNVPPFIEEGETIRVDTETGEYLERAKG